MLADKSDLSDGALSDGAPSDGADEPPMPSDTWRPVISVALFIHLFCVFVGFTGGQYPSQLHARLIGLLKPYMQPLLLDLNRAPYALTRAEPADADHHVQVLPKGLDAAEPKNWRALPGGEAGWRGGERYKRHQRFARRMILAVENDTVSSLMAQGVAANFMNQRGEPIDQVRFRRHLLLSPDQALGADAAARDLNNAMHFQTPYTAAVLKLPSGAISVSKIDAASESARPVTENQP